MTIELCLHLIEPPDITSFSFSIILLFLIPSILCCKKLCCDKTRKSKKSIPQNIRKQVWQMYFKNNTHGQCYACNRTIYIDCWHCSHVIAEQLGGKCTIENLRPCCPYCNLSMRTQNLYDYIKKRQLSGAGSKKRQYK